MATTVAVACPICAQTLNLPLTLRIAQGPTRNTCDISVDLTPKARAAIDTHASEHHGD